MFTKEQSSIWLEFCSSWLFKLYDAFILFHLCKFINFLTVCLKISILYVSIFVHTTLKLIILCSYVPRIPVGWWCSLDPWPYSVLFFIHLYICDIWNIIYSTYHIFHIYHICTKLKASAESLVYRMYKGLCQISGGKKKQLVQ